jgi:hypothetical protein
VTARQSLLYLAPRSPWNGWNPIVVMGTESLTVDF